jgi:hypothetical protein
MPPNLWKRFSAKVVKLDVADVNMAEQALDKEKKTLLIVNMVSSSYITERELSLIELGK